MKLSVITVTIGLAIATIAAIEPGWAHPHAPLAVKINPDDRTELLRLDFESGETDVLYRTAGDRITDVRVSPYYSRVAVLETASTAVNRLVVINAEGRRLRAIDADVRRFVFSPNGRELACIAGPFYAGGIGFRPERAFIVDIDGGGEPLGLAGLEKAHDLHWLRTPTEDSIYFKVLRDGDDRVLRWDVTAGSLEETTLEAIRFSPDGEYLLRKPYETVEVGDCEPGVEGDSCLRVMERRSGNEFPSLAAQEGTAQGWVYDRGHHLLFIQRTPHTETATESRGGQDFQAELITGYSPAQGLVFEVGSGKPPVPVVGVIGGDGSTGDWVTGDRGIIMTSSEPDLEGSGNEGTLAVCEQLPCQTRDEGPETDPETRTGPDVPGLPAPRDERLDPAGDAEFQYANPRFRWMKVNGAAWYRLEICRDHECGVRVGGSEKIEGTEWRSSALPMGELYWQLAAVEVSGTGAPIVGEFTQPRRFFVRSDRVDLDPPVAVVKTRSQPGERVVKGDISLNTRTVGVVPQVDDDLSGVEWWRAEIDGLPVADSRETDVGLLEGPWSDGVHQVDVSAEDRAGNRSAVASARFVVDAQPPEMILQFVTPEVLFGGSGTATERSRPSALDFEWFDLTGGSELGITSVFFDRPGRARKRQTRERGSESAALSFKSSWSELVLVVRGEWPFSPQLEAEANGRRLMWLAAVDDRSGVASLELRTSVEPGGSPVVEIIATDLVGNVSPPLILEMNP